MRWFALAMLALVVASSGCAGAGSQLSLVDVHAVPAKQRHVVFVNATLRNTAATPLDLGTLEWKAQTGDRLVDAQGYDSARFGHGHDVWWNFPLTQIKVPAGGEFVVLIVVPVDVGHVEKVWVEQPCAAAGCPTVLGTIEVTDPL